MVCGVRMKEIELTRDLIARGFGYEELARLARQGELDHVRRGSYARPAANLDDRQRYLRLIRATIGHCSSEAVLSNQSAAAVHGLPLWFDELDRVHVIGSERSSGKIRRYVHLRRAALDPAEVQLVDELEVTVPARTVVDLARAQPLFRSVPVGDAALAGRVTEAELADALDRAAGWPGIARARRAVAMLDPLSQSPGESSSRVVLDDHGVAQPLLQCDILNEHDETVGCVDFCWPALGTLGEFDGKIKYGRLLRPGQSASDVVFAEKQREDALRDLGWQVVRWTWSDLIRPRELLDRLSRAFARPTRIRGSILPASAPSPHEL